MREPGPLSGGVVALLAAALTAVPGPVAAWGGVGHRLVTEAAIDALPPVLRRAYAPHREFLREASLDPDRWRDGGPSGDPLCDPDVGSPVLEGEEGPRHYLDADAVAAYPFREIPRDYRAYRELAGDRLATWGTAPWTIVAYTELLAAGMAAGDRERILCRSAILAHYVADLAQPFHQTMNYDGQLSGLDGIHFRFESDLVEAYAPTLEARVRLAAPLGTVLDDPLEASFGILVEGYPDLYRLLGADLRAQETAPLSEGRQGADNPAYLRAFWERAGEVAADRLRHATAMVASFWFTAWHRAGRPELESLRQPPGR